MEKVKEVIAKVTHKEPSSSTTGTHSTGTHADTHTGAHSGTHTGAHSGTHSGTHTGAHSETHTGPSVKDRLDPRVDSDHDGSRNAGFTGAQNTNTGYGGQQTSSGLTGGSHQHSTSGPHSSLGDKFDSHTGSAQHGVGAQNTNTGYGEQTSSGLTGGSHETGHSSAGSNYGPHSSKIANVLDPRVDSDQDGSRTVGAKQQHGVGAQNTDTGYGGQQTSSGLTGGSQHTTSGPHSSLGNKLDSHSGSTQQYGGQSTNSGYGEQSTNSGYGGQSTNSGYGGQQTSSGLTGSSQNTTPGPHSSLGDKLDPRVDSDQDGSRNFGSTQYGAGAHNTNSGYGGQQTSSGLTGGSQHTTSGPHSSLGNKLDPRVDSDQDGSRNAGFGGQNTNNDYGGQQTSSGLTGSSHQHTTTGPHSIPLANRLDPRVDSDRDGSKTVGNNPQY